MTNEKKKRQGPGKNHGGEEQEQKDADNPAEPDNPGYPEGVQPVAGHVEDALKEDMI